MTTLLARRIVRTHAVMGTMASVHVHDQVDVATVDAAIDATWSELDRLEQIFSTFRPSSEISRINRGELHLLDASPEVIEVVDACTWLEHASDGAFRARRPGDATDRSGRIRQGLGRRARCEVPRPGRPPALVPLRRRRHADARNAVATDPRGESVSPIRTAMILAACGHGGGRR